MERGETKCSPPLCPSNKTEVGQGIIRCHRSHMMSQDVTCFIGVEACAARASPVIAARANWMFDDLKSDAKGMCPRDLELPRRSWTLRCRGRTLICRGRTRILWRGLDPNQSLMVLREGCERSVWVPKQNMSQTPPPIARPPPRSAGRCHRRRRRPRSGRD